MFNLKTKVPNIAFLFIYLFIFHPILKLEKEKLVKMNKSKGTQIQVHIFILLLICFLLIEIYRPKITLWMREPRKSLGKFWKSEPIKKK